MKILTAAVATLAGVAVLAPSAPASAATYDLPEGNSIAVGRARCADNGDTLYRVTWADDDGSLGWRIIRRGGAQGADGVTSPFTKLVRVPATSRQGRAVTIYEEQSGDFYGTDSWLKRKARCYS